MAYPVVPMQRSVLLGGQQNGRLDADIMRTVPAGSGTVTLIHPAARSWAAMHVAAKADGIILGSVGSYRTYAEQVKLFTSRYTTTYLSRRPYKVWQGRRWYLKPGEPVTAVPGTSNHGWGSAVDAANVTTRILNWLIAHERLYGWSHELQSESWHVRYWAGDNLTAAVRAYEAIHPTPEQPEEDMTPEQAQTLNEVHWMLNQVKPNTDRLPAMQGSLDQVNWGVLDPEDGLRTAVAGLSNRVAELEKQLAEHITNDVP